MNPTATSSHSRRFAGKTPEPLSFNYKLTLGISSIPFVLLSSCTGWDITVPLYFALYVLLSNHREFYYPTPRTIELPVAKALPIALVLTYTAAICVSVRGFGRIPTIGFEPTLWQTAHVGLPVVVSVVKETFKGSMNIPTGVKSVWGDADIPYLSRFQGLILFISSTAHVLFMVSCVRLELGSRGTGLVYCSAGDVMQFALVGLAIILWLFFTVWDLRRVNATDVSWTRAVLYIALGTVLFGPASCLAATWCWREVTLERSRTREAIQPKVEA